MRSKPYVPTWDGSIRRGEILQAVANYQHEAGWYPTIREVAERVGLLSKSTTHYHILLLLQAGLLEQNDTHSQLRITGAGRAELPIPYLPTSKVSS